MQTASRSANVVDSSAWLEYFANGPNAAHFAAPIEAISRLVVPTIALFEVYKRMDAQRGRAVAHDVVAQMLQGRVVDVDSHVALTAAQLSRSEKLPLADSIVLAIARLENAELWTQDADFEHMPGVHYYPKTSRPKQLGRSWRPSVQFGRLRRCRFQPAWPVIDGHTPSPTCHGHLHFWSQESRS